MRTESYLWVGIIVLWVSLGIIGLLTIQHVVATNTQLLNATQDSQEILRRSIVCTFGLPLEQRTVAAIARCVEEWEPPPSQR